MGEREMLMYVAVGVVALGYFVSTIRSAANTTQHEQEAAQTAPNTGSPGSVPTPIDTNCGDLFKQCVASIQTKVQTCQKKALEAKVQELLASPMKIENCQRVQDDLEQNCPTGCELDYGTLIVVPGKIKVSTNTTPDEFGNCLASGSRPVTVKASCRRVG